MKPISSLKKLFSFLIILSFALSCSPEIEVFTSLSDGQKVKSIKVVYHDEYGDTPAYDGQYYSWVEFDRRGKIRDIKRGTLRESPDHEHINFMSRSYFKYSIDNMVWYLDYGSYPDESLLGMNMRDWVTLRLKVFEKYPLKNKNVTFNPMGNPQGMTMIMDNGAVTELFQYDSNERPMMWTRIIKSTLSSGEMLSSTLTRNFAYNNEQQLISIKEENEETKIAYDENGHIVEVVLEKDGSQKIKHKYFYNDIGLRSKSITYNALGEAEFSQKYEYLYF